MIEFLAKQNIEQANANSDYLELIELINLKKDI